MTDRTGWDTIADLLDAPENLRALADFAHDDPHEPVGTALGPDQRAELHRYADAIQEFLDGVDTAHRKAYTYLGAVVVIGAFIGAVTTWVLTR